MDLPQRPEMDRQRMNKRTSMHVNPPPPPPSIQQTSLCRAGSSRSHRDAHVESKPMAHFMDGRHAQVIRVVGASSQCTPMDGAPVCPATHRRDPFHWKEGLDERSMAGDITGTRILWMAALFCMPNRTNCILLILLTSVSNCYASPSQGTFLRDQSPGCETKWLPLRGQVGFFSYRVRRAEQLLHVHVL
jgi:hypothetical protein